jgi:hypothetical protein
MNRSGLVEKILDANSQLGSLAYANLGAREDTVCRDRGDILLAVGIQCCGCDV